jgi:hypothetical protein
LRHFRRTPRLYHHHAAKQAPKERAHPRGVSSPNLNPGNVLLSHTVAHAVPSAQRGLTTVFGMGTGVALSLWSPGKSQLNSRDRLTSFVLLNGFNEFYGQASRPISTGKLNTSLHLHIRPINLVVFEGSSATEVEGYLIFGWASRLDAFSAYPFRAQLPSAAPGGTTGTLEARGFRSSRTRKPSHQVSCAHSR